MVPQTLSLVRPETGVSAPGVSPDAADHSPDAQLRSSGSPQRSGSWGFAAPDGAYSDVIAWTSGADWLDALMDALNTMAGEQLRRRAKVARGTLLMVANADRLSADARSGRSVTTAHETVAAALGMSSKTVQRSRQLLEALGFAVTIVEGRYLTVDERRRATETHGGKQIKAASLRALTMPRPAQAVRNVHLSPARRARRVSSVHEMVTNGRAIARQTAASRPKSPMTKRVSSEILDVTVIESPRPLPIQRLAAQLARRVGWLNTGKHIGSLCNALVMAGIDAERWSARDLIDSMDSYIAERHLSYPTQTRNPLGFLRWILAAAVDPNQLTPSELRAERDAERRARVERQISERSVERERLASIDQLEVDQIIAASNEEIAARNAESAARIERERVERIEREERERRARLRAAIAASKRK